MTKQLRIAVADDEPEMVEYFREILPLLGHEVVAAAATGLELTDACSRAAPDLVITDIRMPDMDGIDAASRICETRPVPVILVSGYHDAALVERAGSEHILGYLVKPIKQADLEPAIGIACRRFAQFEELQREAADLRQALQDRKVIERAKGILMRRADLDEPAAFQRLQRLASQNNRKLVQIAEMILTAEEAFSPAEKDKLEKDRAATPRKNHDRPSPTG